MSLLSSEGDVMRIRLTVFLFILMLSVLTFPPSRASNAKAPRAFVAYLYVEVETKVYRKGVEISGENPEERRWYFSNVVEEPEDVPSYSLVKQKFMPYFS